MPAAPRCRAGGTTDAVRAGARRPACTARRCGRPPRAGTARAARPGPGTIRRGRQRRVQPLARAGVAGPFGSGEFPRARLFNVAVGLLDDGPHGGGGAPEIDVAEGRVDDARRLNAAPHQISARSRGIAVHTPGAVAVCQSDDAVDHIAGTTGEVVVGAGDQPGDGEIGVAHPGHLAQQPPAHRVRAVPVGQGDRVHRRPGRLADLGPVDGEVVVDEDVGGQRQPGRQQHRRPVDGVEPQHTLADEVHPAVAARPPATVGVPVAAVVQARDVVAQCVPPDVDHLAGVARHRDAPAPGALGGTGDGKVAQPGGGKRRPVAGRFVDTSTSARPATWRSRSWT